jgi:hypothetical protein
MHAGKNPFTQPVCFPLNHEICDSGPYKANMYTENACAAIAKILHFNKQSVQDPQAVANEWY